MEQNFREIYQLDKSERMLSKTSKIGGKSLEGRIKNTLDFGVPFGKYEIRKNGESDEIRFSSDNYRENHYDTLIVGDSEKRTLFKKIKERILKTIKKRENPFIVLAYDSENDESTIRIQYIQSTNRMKKTVYQNLNSTFNVNPHEFLLAQFLYRISPILDSSPEIKVKVQDWYLDKNPVYSKLRDRFFDSKYNLNPNKERVKQILGENNSWLKSREK